MAIPLNLNRGAPKGGAPKGAQRTGLGGVRALSHGPRLGAPPRQSGPNFSSALYHPGQPLSGPALYNAAVNLANAQVNPSIKAIADQISQGNQTASQAEKDISGYYQGLGQYAQQGNQQLGQISSGLNSQLQGIAGDENTQMQGIGQNATSSLQKYTPGDPSIAAPALQSLSQELARQQGLAAQNEGAYRAAGATQGANYQGLGSANLGAFATRGEENLGQVASANFQRQAPLTSKLAALQEQRGALIGTDLGKLRQQEVANQFTSKSLGIRQQSVADANANNIANQNIRVRGQNITLNGQQQAQMRSDRTFQLDQQKFGAAQAKDAYLRSHGLGPYRLPGAGGKMPATTPTGQRTLSPQQQQVKFGQVDALRSLIPEMQQPLSAKVAKAYGLPAGTRLTEAQIRQDLAAGNNPAGVRYDPALIDSAYALQGWGFLTNNQITELNKLGLIVGNRYRRGSLPPANPTPAQAGVGGSHR